MSSAGIRRTGQGVSRGEGSTGSGGCGGAGAGTRLLAPAYYSITEGQREATGKTSRKRESGGYRGIGWIGKRSAEVKAKEGREEQTVARG